MATGLLKSKKGQSMVETALVLPIVILILTGIIDFGIMFSNYILITGISREAARAAALGCTDSDVRLSAQDMAQTLDKDKMYVNIYPAEAYREKGSEVSVTVEYYNTMFTPVISSIVGNPLKLTSKTTMRVE